MTATFTPPLAGAARVGATAPVGLDAAATGDRGAKPAGLMRLMRLTPLFEAAIVVSIWLLNRLYLGIVNDTRIYVGRALADLDPRGLGREPAFLYDQQTTHTIFSHLLRPLVASFGASATSMGVTLATLLIWLAAAAGLAHQLMPRRMVPAALICAAILSPFYGPFDIFAFGQALATPRGFAEAGVMAALAALVGGRRWLCAALLLLAAAFHPIMAAPGFGVLFLVLAREDRRWWGLAPLGLVALLAAAALHLGPAKSLFVAFDPDWRRVVYRYKAFLFIANWPLTAWCGAALSAATLALAVMVLQGRRRAIALAALIMAAAGVAASVLFGDLCGSVLFVQLQPWRALWIVQVLAVLLVPVLAVELWTTGRRDARMAMVLLGLGWIEFNETPTILPLLAAVLGFAASARWRRTDLTSAMALRVVAVGVLALIAWMTLLKVAAALALIQLYARLPFAVPLYSFDMLKLHVFPIFAIAMAPLLFPAPSLFPARIKPVVRGFGLALAALLLVPLAALAWDQRTPTRKMTDLGQGRAELNRLIGPATGSGVVWMPDDNAPWFLLSRATWVSDLQGAVGTFSRPLIMQWRKKTTALVASGLGKVVNFDPRVWPPLAQTGDEAESRAGALKLCALKDGPQAIVLAGDLTQRFAPGVAMRWRAPTTGVWRAPGVTPTRMITFDFYTIVRCDKVSAMAAKAAGAEGAGL